MLRLLPQEMADNYLLEMLPGLTLQVIDSMDVHRLARALQVRRMRDVEMRRKLYLDDKLSSDDISKEEWRSIRWHDRLIGVEPSD